MAGGRGEKTCCACYVVIVLLHKNRTYAVHMTGRMFVCETCDFCHSHQVRTYLRAAPKTFSRITFAVPENAGACTFQTEEVLLAAREKCSSYFYDRKSAQVFFLLCKSSGKSLFGEQASVSPSPSRMAPGHAMCPGGEKGCCCFPFPFSVVSTRDLPHKSAGGKLPQTSSSSSSLRRRGEGENKNKSIHRQILSLDTQ